MLTLFELAQAIFKLGCIDDPAISGNHRDEGLSFTGGEFSIRTCRQNRGAGFLCVVCTIDRRKGERYESVSPGRNEAFDAQAKRRDIPCRGKLYTFSRDRLSVPIKERLSGQGRFVAGAFRPSIRIAAEPALKRAPARFCRRIGRLPEVEQSYSQYPHTSLGLAIANELWRPQNE